MGFGISGELLRALVLYLGAEQAGLLQLWAPTCLQCWGLLSCVTVSVRYLAWKGLLLGLGPQL